MAEIVTEAIEAAVAAAAAEAMAAAEEPRLEPSVAIPLSGKCFTYVTKTLANLTGSD